MTKLDKKLKWFRSPSYYDEEVGGTSLQKILLYTGKVYLGQDRAFLIKAVRDFAKTAEDLIVSDIIFMALGLLQGYEGIKEIGERRALFIEQSNFVEYFYKDQADAFRMMPSGVDKKAFITKISSNLSKKENLYLNALSSFISRIGDLPSYINDLDGFVLKQTQNGKTLYLPILPAPGYEQNPIYEEVPSPTERKLAAFAEDALNKQADMLSDLRSTQLDTHQSVEAISNNAKAIPAISEGVREANVKLDKLAKVSAQMDRFDSFVDAQTSAGLNSVVYTILGEDMLKYDSAEYEWRAQVLKTELLDHLHRTILHRLPSEALGEVEEFMDTEDPDIGQVDDFIHRNASRWGIDINTIIFDTTTRFVEFYTRRIFEGASSDIVEVTPVQPEPKS